MAARGQQRDRQSTHRSTRTVCGHHSSRRTTQRRLTTLSDGAPGARTRPGSGSSPASIESRTSRPYERRLVDRRSQTTRTGGGEGPNACDGRRNIMAADPHRDVAASLTLVLSAIKPRDPRLPQAPNQQPRQRPFEPEFGLLLKAWRDRKQQPTRGCSNGDDAQLSDSWRCKIGRSTGDRRRSTSLS